MTATATRITCDECGVTITDADEIKTGMCTDCLATWFCNLKRTAVLECPLPVIELVVDEDQGEVCPACQGTGWYDDPEDDGRVIECVCQAVTP